MTVRMKSFQLFKGVENAAVEKIVSMAVEKEKEFAPGDLIAQKGSKLNELYLLTSGYVGAEVEDSAGNKIVAERIAAPAVLAPAFLYADDNVLTLNLRAYSTAKVGAIGRKNFTAIMSQYPAVMTNFLEILSNPKKLLSQRVTYLTYRTIREKLANYLLEIIERDGTLRFRNRLTQNQMSEMFGVTRPALAKTIGELCAEGTIHVKGKQVEVLLPDKLKQYLKK